MHNCYASTTQVQPEKNWYTLRNLSEVLRMRGWWGRSVEEVTVRAELDLIHTRLLRDRQKAYRPMRSKCSLSCSVWDRMGGTPVPAGGGVPQSQLGLSLSSLGHPQAGSGVLTPPPPKGLGTGHMGKNLVLAYPPERTWDWGTLPPWTDKKSENITFPRTSYTVVMNKNGWETNLPPLSLQVD